MSIVCEGDTWWFIDEESFTNKTYRRTLNETNYERFDCDPRMFAINEEFLYDSQLLKCDASNKTVGKKRKRPTSENLPGDETPLQSHLASIINLLKSQQKAKDYEGTTDNNKDARSFQAVVNDLQVTFSDVNVQCEKIDTYNDNISDIMNTSTLDFNRATACLVSNPHKFSIVKDISQKRFLMPPNSTFLMSDITQMERITDESILFDCIVIDPPWQNKSVKRKRVYNSMPMFDLKMLPLRNLFADNCLVIVWVTNKAKIQNYIIKELFPSWKVSFQAMWIWMKVTKSLRPVLPLDGKAKKPYEKLILGRYCGTNPSTRSHQLEEIPQNSTIVSIPSAIHSHKPPLSNVLKPYLPEEPKCLELFARNLQPGWYSWGNEVLMLQNEVFFNNMSKNNDSLQCSEDVHDDSTSDGLIT